MRSCFFKRAFEVGVAVVVAVETVVVLEANEVNEVKEVMELFLWSVE